MYYQIFKFVVANNKYNIIENGSQNCWQQDSG